LRWPAAALITGESVAAEPRRCRIVIEIGLGLGVWLGNRVQSVRQAMFSAQITVNSLFRTGRHVVWLRVQGFCIFIFQKEWSENEKKRQKKKNILVLFTTFYYFANKLNY
jgi:hypothetical protein